MTRGSGINPRRTRTPRPDVVRWAARLGIAMSEPGVRDRERRTDSVETVVILMTRDDVPVPGSGSKVGLGLDGVGVAVAVDLDRR
jgi:hypothetical protein